jgi:hypothetical protein
MHLPLPSCQRQHCFCPSPHFPAGGLPYLRHVVKPRHRFIHQIGTRASSYSRTTTFPTSICSLVCSTLLCCPVSLLLCVPLCCVVLCFALLSCSHRKLGCVRSRLLTHPSTLTSKSLVTLRSTRCRPRRVPSPLRRPSLPRRRSGPRARLRTRYVSLPFAACSLLSIVHFR